MHYTNCHGLICLLTEMSGIHKVLLIFVIRNVYGLNCPALALGECAMFRSPFFCLTASSALLILVQLSFGPLLDELHNIWSIYYAIGFVIFDKIYADKICIIDTNLPLLRITNNTLTLVELISFGLFPSI